jgi:two-component system nitrate/nitrite response regulator NarL
VGNSNKLIARNFDIAEATVKIHVKNILRKLKTQNRTQAALWARENGIYAQATTVQHSLGLAA